jgi:hypothetical protein
MAFGLPKASTPKIKSTLNVKNGPTAMPKAPKVSGGAAKGKLPGAGMPKAGVKAPKIPMAGGSIGKKR